jgi:hypothetical protein
MGQKLFQDKIGTLNYSAGNIVMTASVSNPAYLTIGGKQHKITTSLSVSANLSSANTRYQVYAVLSGGIPALVISQNENSQGPSGFSFWKLIGSYYSNGLISIGFGSFVNTEGTPRTQNPIPLKITIKGSVSDPTPGNIVGEDASYIVDGDVMYIHYDLFINSAGTGGSGIYYFEMPAPFALDPLKYPGLGNQVQPVLGAAEANIGGSNGTGHVLGLDAFKLMLNITSTSNLAQALGVGSTWYSLANSSVTYSFDARIMLYNGSSKPIKDL